MNNFLIVKLIVTIASLVGLLIFFDNSLLLICSFTGLETKLWHHGAMLLHTTSNYFFYYSSLFMSLHFY